jgi:hypothetical protein
MQQITFHPSLHLHPFSMTISNPELQLAEDFVQHTNCHIFLTGRAGTGKTTFLHDLKKKTHKRMVVTAPTGVAAINAGGMTLHSFFQLPFGPFVPGSENSAATQRIRKEKINIIKSMDLLVIDEISMVRADLLDAVDAVLKRFRHSSLPFGGVQLLMIGDLLQLSPVVKEAEWQILRQYYPSMYFFDSNALRQTELIPIELKHIYRQSDPRFIALLNRVRDRKVDDATLKELNERYISNFSPNEDEGFITLCTHNSSADTINLARLQAVRQKSHHLPAEIEGDFPEHIHPAPALLELKVDAQVMFVRNDPSPEKRYFNGKIGKITRISGRQVSVRCPQDSREIEVEPTVWENIEYTLDQKSLEITQNKIGSFLQFPLKPAWAITIHKSQGLTFDKAIIDAGAAFTHGQVYVALSRCKTFEGMVLSTPLSALAVKADATVLRFIQQAASNPPTPTKLAAARVGYQQQLLTACFDFQYLRSRLGRLAGLLLKNAQIVHVSGTTTGIRTLEKSFIDEVFTVGENFKLQLARLFATNTLPESDAVILERLAKASVYFEDKLTGLLIPFIKDIRIDTDNKEIQKKAREALAQLEQETAVKLAAVLSCRSGFSPADYLRAIAMTDIDLKPAKEKKQQAIAIQESDIDHPALLAILKDWRAKKAGDAKIAHYQVLHQKTLLQIAVRMPDSLQGLATIKGIGKKLLEKYGPELVALVARYRQEHNIEAPVRDGLPGPEKGQLEKADTRQISFEMFADNIPIEQIAERRGFTASTIVGHLISFVESGALAIDRLVEPGLRLAIEQKIARMPGARLGELKQALGEDVSYDAIRMVIANLRFLERK